MKQQEKVLLISFIVLSVLSSFAFIYYGVGVISDVMASRWLTIFAYVTTAYGMGNMAVLSLAWSTRSSWAAHVNMVMALSYLGVFVMDVVNIGIQGGLEIVGILGVAVVLWCNWMTIKKVVERPE
jgi:hypothetical protein